ncbi:hypothetical protein E2P81_ATG00030 [Venturia nashicola]|nr:hypothetical protein E2P81_ATG00030 [Venturia nashicola]
MSEHNQNQAKDEQAVTQRDEQGEDREHLEEKTEELEHLEEKKEELEHLEEKNEELEHLEEKNEEGPAHKSSVTAKIYAPKVGTLYPVD